MIAILFVLRGWIEVFLRWFDIPVDDMATRRRARAKAKARKEMQRALRW